MGFGYLLFSSVIALPFFSADCFSSAEHDITGTRYRYPTGHRYARDNMLRSVRNDSNNVTMTLPVEHCGHEALTDGFGIIVQGILAVLAFSSLILKRLREPKEERRSWKIWFYDTSKQALGAGVIHLANVFLSAELSHNDPCIWYIVYFLLDSTFGLFFIYICVKISQCIVKRGSCKTLYFGEYGDPPMCEAWVGQCGLFILIVVVEKVVITLFATLDFWSEVARTLLSPIHNPKVEVVIVMLLVPFVLNAIMFWVVDNFLMRKRKKAKEDCGSNGAQARYFKLKKTKTTDESSGSESEGLLSQEDENGETVILTPRGMDSCNERTVGRL